MQAHALLPLLRAEPAAARCAAAWVEHAGRVSVRRLGDDVAEAIASGTAAPPPLAPAAAGGGDPEAESDAAAPAGLQTGVAARLPREDCRLFFTAEAEVAQLFRAMLATVQRRLERIRGRPSCVSDALEAMLDHALAAWQPEPPTARERREQRIYERDGWRCTAPGCTSQRNLQRHHIVFRSQGGSDAPSNLTTLCAWHHLRGVHGRVLRCTGTAPDALRFELPVGVYTSGDVIAG